MKIIADVKGATGADNREARVKAETMETKNAYQTIIDHLPLPVFLMDGDARIHMSNPAARALLQPESSAHYLRRFGEALDCIHAAAGCGLGPQCPSCPVRETVGMAERGVRTVRNSCELRVVREGRTQVVHVLFTASPITFDDGCLHVVVLEDITELHTLKRLLPMCAACKKVRQEDGDWAPIEIHLQKHELASVTHGLCSDCVDAFLRGEEPGR